MTTTVRNIRDGSYDATNSDHVYIGRANKREWLEASKWANPIAMPSELERHHVIAGYRAYLLRNQALVAALPELRGKTLYCWCAPKACHGDVLSELVEDVVKREQGPSSDGPDEWRWRTFAQEATA